MRTAPVDIASLARFILSSDCQKIGVLTGAGVSVASGIPDFRSPGGMYDSLKPELLTATRNQRRLMEMDPTYVVSWQIFCQNPFPYLEVRRPFILGTREQKWKATLFHRFLELIDQKTNKLQRIYTQNIDGLDFQTDIPNDKIVAVHGSIGQVKCEGCGHSADFDAFCDQVQERIKDIYGENNGPKESTFILCENCGKPLVKPSTVLFGRALPIRFFECLEHDDFDVLLVAGTSLVVSPANYVVTVAGKETIRVVINREPVGMELGIDYSGEGRDCFAQGDCEDVALELLKELDWLDDIAVDKLPPASADMLREARQTAKKRE